MRILHTESSINWGGQEYRALEQMEWLQAHGVIINRPPRDGRMAFVRSPDGISVELLQRGEALGPEEPWLSMENVGSW